MIETQIERYLHGFRAKTILDVGPGYVDYSRKAARITHAVTVTYLDVDSDVLEYQRKKSIASGLTVRTISAPLSTEVVGSMDRGAYELIICTEVLEHLNDAEEILAGLAQLLTPNGRILITVPTGSSERWLKFLDPAYMKDEPYGHVREFDAADLKRILQHAELTPLVFHSNNPHYFVSQSWLVGMRVKVKGATGTVVANGWRVEIFRWLTSYSFKVFTMTGYRAYLLWAWLLPRNYFVIAARTAPRALFTHNAKDLSEHN